MSKQKTAPELSPAEALAEAWASIDGKLEAFRACKSDPGREDVDGHFQGYMVEADEMIVRLARRGYRVVPVETTDGT